MTEAPREVGGSAEAHRKPVVSIVQDGRNKGGVATVNRWYRRWMEVNRPGSNTEIFLDEFDRSFAFVRKLGRAGRSGALPRLLPKLHVPQYVGGRFSTRRLLARASEVHVLGGVAVHGYLAAGRAPMLVWIGTTIGSERRAVIPLQLLPRRWLHRSTLSGLEYLETRALRDAKRVLVQSAATADDVLALGVASSAIELRLVPVDTELFRPDDQPRRGMLFVGRVWDPRKNFDACIKLLESSSIARDEGLDVVSSGEPSPQAVALGAALRWHGKVEDVSAVYRRAKILLLPSVQEGLGIVVLEAFASGTPVVAMASGGPDDIIRESGGGFVVRSSEEFRKRVEELLKDDSARAEMARSGRDWCEKNASARSFLGDGSIFRLNN